jgi:hypothetical protein
MNGSQDLAKSMPVESTYQEIPADHMKVIEHSTAWEEELRSFRKNYLVTE